MAKYPLITSDEHQYVAEVYKQKSAALFRLGLGILALIGGSILYGSLTAAIIGIILAIAGSVLIASAAITYLHYPAIILRATGATDED